MISEITYTPSSADSFRTPLRTRRRFSRTRYGLLGLGAIFVALGLFCFVPMASSPSNVVEGVAILLVGLFMVALAFGLVWGPLLRPITAVILHRGLGKSSADEIVQSWTQEIRIAVTEDGLISVRPGSETLYYWSGIEGIADEQEMVVFYREGTVPIASIPRRAFHGDAQRASFLDNAIQTWDRRKEDPRPAIPPARPTAGKMAVEYQYGPEEQALSVLARLENSRSERASRKARWIGYAVSAGLLVWDAWRIKSWVMAIVFAMPVLIAHWKGQRLDPNGEQLKSRYASGLAERIQRNPHLRHIYGRYRVLIAPEGLWIDGESFTSRYDWGRIQDIQETEHLIVFNPRFVAIASVPRDAFSSPGEAERFAALAREYQAAAHRSGSESMSRRY